MADIYHGDDGTKTTNDEPKQTDINPPPLNTNTDTRVVLTNQKKPRDVISPSVAQNSSSGSFDDAAFDKFSKKLLEALSSITDSDSPEEIIKTHINKVFREASSENPRKFFKQMSKYIHPDKLEPTPLGGKLKELKLLDRPFTYANSLTEDKKAVSNDKSEEHVTRPPSSYYEQSNPNTEPKFQPLKLIREFLASINTFFSNLDILGGIKTFFNKIWKTDPLKETPRTPKVDDSLPKECSTSKIVSVMAPNDVGNQSSPEQDKAGPHPEEPEPEAAVQVQDEITHEVASPELEERPRIM